MRILFQEEQVYLESNPIIEDIIKKINELLKDEYYFNHLRVDGQDVFENPELYLKEHIQGIEQLEIIAIPAKDFINDLLLSAEEYIERAIPHLKDLSEEFYHNAIKESWEELANLFEGAQWLIQMVHIIEKSLNRPKNWDIVMESVQSLQSEMESLEEALENGDTVLIGDMLQYEFLPVFTKMAKEVKNAIDTEGTRHDLS